MLKSKIYNAFVNDGFIKVEQAIPQYIIDKYTINTLKLLNDPSNKEFLEQFGSHVYFPKTESFDPQIFCPKLWKIIEFLVGKNNILSPITWGNGFVSARPISTTEQIKDFKESWHKDGFFRHFIDSPEIGLICFLLWTDVDENCGATEIAVNSTKDVAQVLLKNPQGLEPDFFQNFSPQNYSSYKLTGKKGDVYLMHPFLLHKRKPNYCSYWRLITNPFIQLNKPLFTNSKPSVLELSILAYLGCKKVEFKREGKREIIKTKTADKLNKSRNELIQLQTKYS